MGNLLQAIGRAKPATQIEQYRTAITNRENETLRTQAYVQSQENNARLQAQQLERIQRQNQIEKQTLIENDKIVPIESITDSLMYPEMRALVKKFGMQKGYLTEDGSSFKKGDEAKFLQDMQKGQFAELMMRTRIDVSKRHYNENQSLIDEAMSKGDVKKAAKLKENSASLKTNLERAQAMSETYKARMEEEIKRGELAVKEKTPDIKNYEAAVAQGYKGKFNEWILDVKKAGSQNITVNTGSVGKTTQNKLEDSIISGEKNIDMLTRLDDMYNPTFLEYTGKARAGLEDYLSKVGLSKGEYLQKRAKWASEVDTFTLLWRKHITGVAGGPQEMKAIEKTVINTKYDSPAKYKAKREQMEIMTRAAIAKDKAYLANGIDLSKQTPKQREIISKTDPLSNYYPTAQKGIDNLYEKFGLEK